MKGYFQHATSCFKWSKNIIWNNICNWASVWSSVCDPIIFSNDAIISPCFHRQQVSGDLISPTIYVGLGHLPPFPPFIGISSRGPRHFGAPCWGFLRGPLLTMLHAWSQDIVSGPLNHLDKLVPLPPLYYCQTFFYYPSCSNSFCTHSLALWIHKISGDKPILGNWGMGFKNSSDLIRMWLEAWMRYYFPALPGDSSGWILSLWHRRPMPYHWILGPTFPLAPFTPVYSLISILLKTATVEPSHA